MTVRDHRAAVVDGRCVVCGDRARVFRDAPRHIPGRTVAPADDRFWGMVDQSGDCWEWTGARTVAGWHGRFWPGRGAKPVMAHRFSWELTNGPIPDGLSVLHRCDNPPCVNPAHLFLGTQRDNMRDAGRKGRMGTANRNRTHCKRGHLFDGHRAKDGRRFCHVCYLDRQREIRSRPEQRATARERTRLWKATSSGPAAPGRSGRC